MYEAKKQQNLQQLDILACNSANKPSWYINRVIDQNIQKLSIFTVFSSYIASILKRHIFAAHLSCPVTQRNGIVHILYQGSQNHLNITQTHCQEN